MDTSVSDQEVTNPSSNPVDSEGPRRVASVTVTEVLGEYTHSLRIDPEHNYAIVYGPNGVGKTKFLEIIEAACTLNSEKLSLLPFMDCSILFDDEGKLEIERRALYSTLGTEDGDIPEGDMKNYSIKYIHKPKNGVESSWSDTDVPITPRIRRHIEIRGLERVSDFLWRNPDDGSLTSIEDLAEYANLRAPVVRGNPRMPRREASSNKARLRVEKYLEGFTVSLIEAQRLRNSHGYARLGGDTGPRRRVERPRVVELAERLKEILRDAQTKHSEISQRHDRTFPSRVLKYANQETDENEEEIRERYARQSDLRNRWAKVAPQGVAEDLALPTGPLEEWSLNLLRQHVDDADKKMEPFVEILNRIELLEGVVNCLLIGKSLSVTVAEGLKIVKAGTGDVIPLEHLSSGEQHEIILICDLLFNVKSGSLVLIDEPEISMHVAWQVAFMKDLVQIAQAVGFCFVVATHSPQIIDNRWGLTTRLGPEGFEL